MEILLADIEQEDVKYKLKKLILTCAIVTVSIEHSIPILLISSFILRSLLRVI